MPLYEIDKAIIKDESGKNIVVPIEQDNRFFYWIFEPALSQAQQKFELFDLRDPKAKKINDIYYYVPIETGERLDQHNIDSLLREKILHSNIQDLPCF